VFFDDDDRRFYLETLKRYTGRWSLEIWAYCLMTNHVHLLAVPGNELSLARGMGGLNLVYTQYFNRKYEKSGRLWQNRFFSTVIEEERYLWAVASYIERNPVRAGIVNRPQEYAWSSYMAHAHDSPDHYLLGRAWLADSDRSDYRGLCRRDENADDSAIRRATATGRPLGGAGFFKGLEGRLTRKLEARRVGRPPMKEDKSKQGSVPN